MLFESCCRTVVYAACCPRQLRHKTPTWHSGATLPRTNAANLWANCWRSASESWTFSHPLSSTSCLHNVASVPHLPELPLKACNRIAGFAQTTQLYAAFWLWRTVALSAWTPSLCKNQVNGIIIYRKDVTSSSTISDILFMLFNKPGCPKQQVRHNKISLKQAECPKQAKSLHSFLHKHKHLTSSVCLGARSAAVPTQWKAVTK